MSRTSTGLFRTTAAIVVYKTLATGASAGTAVFTARQLGPGGRGVFVLLLTVASFATLLGSLGLNLGARIHLVAPGGEVECADFVGLTTVLAVADAIGCVLIGAILLPLVSVHLAAEDAAVLGLLAGTLLAAFLLNATLNAYGLTARAAAIDAAGSIAQLAATIGLFVAGERDVTAYVGAFVVGNALQVVFSMYGLRSLGVALRPRIRWRRWGPLVRTGAPGIAADVAGTLTFRLDRYLLALFVDPVAVGVYSVAATAPELLRLPALALSQPLFHRVASRTARVQEFARARFVCLVFTGALAGAVFAAAPWAVRFFFGPRFAGAVTPLRILLLAEFGIALQYIDGASLAAMSGRLRAPAVAAVVGCAVVVVADLVLIPAYGVVGAAWASVAAYSANGLVVHGFLRRCLTADSA